MFNKILIANRGDLVPRFIKTCKSLGSKSIVAHSSIDDNLKYLENADETILLKGNDREVYKDIGQIIDIAKKSNAEAILPGWGFISESPEFAKACEDSGIEFIGPNSQTMASVGDKAQSRVLADSVGIPIVKGSGIIHNYREAKSQIKSMNFPLKIYAVAGGGGKGMKQSYSIDDFKVQFKLAQSEGDKFFGNPDVAIQEYLPEIRHVEVQILADKFGNAVHFGTRDCSTQRRFQKLIEEAPAPCLDTKLEQDMLEHAVSFAKSAGYHGAGTIEYMVVGDNYYWGEMNARLQVENGVSEEISSIHLPRRRAIKPDLLKEMIRIAAGEKLGYSQENIHFKGHAMEFRINAEIAQEGFSPSLDLLVTHYHPPHGIGVRVESCIYDGYEIPHIYDSMIGKIIVKGRNRNNAISRGLKALDHTIIEGVQTTIPFYAQFINYEQFKKSGFSTEIVLEFMPKFKDIKIDEDKIYTAHGCFNPLDYEN
jgi:acetyl-CoA carboxylase, biotin carboxylase subunit